MFNPIPVLRLAVPKLIPAIIENWKPIAGGLAALIICMKIYAWGAAGVQADWDKAESLRIKNLMAERDEAQKYAAGIAAEYADFRRRSTQGMYKIRKELADEIAKSPSLRGCNATAGFVRLYNQTRAGAALLPAD